MPAKPTDFKIRPAQPSDFDQWKKLWDGYNEFYGRHGKNALADEITHRTWSRFFDGYEPIHAVVAEQSGKILGFAHFILHRSTISLEPNCYLQDLFTLATDRGKGVGRALIEEVYRRAQHAGCGRVYWHTHKTNSIAMKLYDQVAEDSGFVVYRKMLK